MTAGEFFINLGIKGTDTASKAIKGVKEGLNDTASSGLAAKAAIIGAVYALERMLASSAKFGTGLTNFAAITDQSTQALQRWQYAGKLAGMSADDVEGNFKGLFKTLTDVKYGLANAPRGLDTVVALTGFDIDKGIKDLPYAMSKLVQAAKIMSPEIGREMFKSFGVTDSMYAASRRNAFDPKTLARAPILSTQEIANLTEMNSLFGDSEYRIEKLFRSLSANKSTLDFIREVNKMVIAITDLINAFSMLEEKYKVFETIGGLTKKSGTGLFATAFEAAAGLMGGKGNPDIGGLAPAMNQMLPQQNKSSNNSITQNMYFQHDGKDAQRTGDSVKKGSQEYLRQINSMIQAN